MEPLHSRERQNNKENGRKIVLRVAEGGGVSGGGTKGILPYGSDVGDDRTQALGDQVA